MCVCVCHMFMRRRAHLFGLPLACCAVLFLPARFIYTQPCTARSDRQCLRCLPGVKYAQTQKAEARASVRADALLPVRQCASVPTHLCASVGQLRAEGRCAPVSAHRGPALADILALSAVGSLCCPRRWACARTRGSSQLRGAVWASCAQRAHGSERGCDAGVPQDRVFACAALASHSLGRLPHQAARLGGHERAGKIRGVKLLSLWRCLATCGSRVLTKETPSEPAYVHVQAKKKTTKHVEPRDTSVESQFAPLWSPREALRKQLWRVSQWQAAARKCGL